MTAPELSRGAIGAMVAGARRALIRERIRAVLLAHVPHILGLAAAFAAARPMFWPLHDGASWHGTVRALVLGASAALGTTVALVIVAWRKRPSRLGAARALDAALDLQEVVASGYAFECDDVSVGAGGRALAVARARGALRDVVPADLFVGARQRAAVPWRAQRGRVIALSAAAVALGVLVGSFDAAMLDRLRNPVTERELSAAAALAHAAAAAPTPSAAPTSNSHAPPPERTLADAARRAAEAAKRGDRKRAVEALDDLRAASRALDASAREQAKALRALRDELDPADPSAGSATDRPTASASEAIKKMRDSLDSGASGAEDRAALRKMAERIARAEREASARADAAGARGETATSAEERDSWSKAASALREAREAAERGDRDAMKRALERAEREVAAMEKAREAAAERSRERESMMSHASRLDRAMRAAQRSSAGSKGRVGEKSDGEGEDGDADGESDSAENGKGDGNGKTSANGGKGSQAQRSPTGAGSPSEGPGAGDRTPGPEGRRVRVNGNLKARADVREGERAVSAIQGLGRGGDPRAFQEVFPSYDSAVEDGLKDERVPAARRTAVRRYFSAIRPSDPPPPTSPQPQPTE